MSTEKIRKDHVNLLLATHLTAMLDGLCKHYDMDRSHMLRRLIYEEFQRITRRESSQSESGSEDAGSVSVRRGPVPPKVSGRSGGKDQSKKHDQDIQKTG